MANKNEVKAFVSGIHNKLDAELIPRDAASHSYGWLTTDGKIELMRGRVALGNEGSAGKVYDMHVGYKVDGTAVFFRKTATKIQYLNGTTWTDIITGLTAGHVSFVNYFSLAGAFVYIYSPQGLWKICTANPGSFADQYNSAKNFKGYAFIDQGRAVMWGVEKDKTGLYLSWIDGQDSTVYTTVSGEAITNVASGTLAFKAGGARRTCFGVSITDTSSGEVFTDDFNGNLTGSLGSTGTINYMTGAFTITGQSGAGTATYQWEDATAKGVMDFSKSTPRQAGEGAIVRQDAGGDAIVTVIPYDGSYFSMKKNSIYRFQPDAADTDPINEIFRTEIGIDTITGAVPTSLGIIFINTSSASEKSLEIVQRNAVGDNFTTVTLMEHFDFNQYYYDDVVLESWDTYLLIACREGTGQNDRLILCDVRNKTADIAWYAASAFCKDDGVLYIGDPVADICYELFNGFDDMTLPVSNTWVSANDDIGDTTLKKAKKLRFRGLIDPNQSVEVYQSIDNSDWQLVGTIVGSADYVDYQQSYAVGTTMIGSETIGGGNDIPVYSFLMEMKIRVPKYRKRRLKFVATGFGYAALQYMADWDIYTFPDKLPRSSRIQQNVSLDGLTTNQDTPTY